MNDKTMHTPGPWFVAQDPRFTIKRNHHIMSNHGGVIAFIASTSMDEDNEVDAANAALIASAPTLLAERDRLRESNKELLAALVSVVAIADRQTVEFGNARAAIAHAREVQS